VESDIFGVHLHFVASEGFGLLVVGPLCMEEKQFSSKDLKLGQLSVGMEVKR